MAMIRCAECRKDISDKAATCPNCGAPVDAVAAKAVQVNSGRRALKWIGGGIAFLVLVKMCSTVGTRSNGEVVPSTSSTPTSTSEAASQASLKYWMADLVNESAPASRRELYANNIIQNFPNTPEATKAKELLPALTAKAVEERTNGAWSYSNNEDEMSGKRVGYAQIRSDNTISLDFPYQGDQFGTLTVRQHPKWGNDVFVSIEKGQILCSTYDCAVRIRFDDGQPVTYTGNEPSDNSSETVFLPYSIAKKLQTAKRIKVELNLFQNGMQVLEFNVKGFDPEKMKPQPTSS